MSKKSAVYVALSLGLIILGAGAFAGTIVHPEIAVYRSTSGDSGPNSIDTRGYLQAATGAVEIPGVIDIVPGGANWPNFVSAEQVSQPYTIQKVTLVKQTPSQSVCPGRFPKHSVVQIGSEIRLHWPLMYEAPGTLFTVTIDYSTPLSAQFAGETAASKVHREIWKWRVATSATQLDSAQELFHCMPFGSSGVPLVSDEILLPTLREQLADASSAYLAADFLGFGDNLAAFRNAVSNSQIMTVPTSASPTGVGMGVANTLENPAADILLLDSAFIEPRTGSSAMSASIDAPDSAAVVFGSSKIVTLVGDGWFYAQNANKTGGVKVIGTKAELSAGMQVLLQGTIGTRGPERILLMTSCEIVTPSQAGAAQTSPLLPLGMSNKMVGGAGKDYLPGFAEMVGLQNSALLVRTWGKVMDTGDGFFYINEGSGCMDGTPYVGLRVILPGGVNAPAKNAYVAVTGISSWFDSRGYGFPAVLLRSGDDVRLLKPAM